jgi:hypothetical protein
LLPAHIGVNVIDISVSHVVEKTNSFLGNGFVRSEPGEEKRERREIGSKSEISAQQPPHTRSKTHASLARCHPKKKKCSQDITGGAKRKRRKHSKRVQKKGIIRLQWRLVVERIARPGSERRWKVERVLVHIWWRGSVPCHVRGGSVGSSEPAVWEGRTIRLGHEDLASAECRRLDWQECLISGWVGWGRVSGQGERGVDARKRID